MGEGEKKFKSFSEFYPYYLSEHGDPVNRRLHFFGSLLTIIVVLFVIFTQTWIALILVPILGYGFAWIGHYLVEKNKPATFTYPLYSLMGDWVMFKDILTGKIKL
ncbi:MAG: Mpo1-like protein [Thermodesulfobacteriota bacterium]